MPTPTLWHIPYQRNPYFTGREDVLTRLYYALQADATVALSHPQGISGLGGIGKTQTVLEYAYRHRDEYDAVLWVRADSIVSLTSSMVELAQVLHLPERNEQDQQVIVQAVLRWLRLQTGWLLIYDNIDDFSLAKPFLPKAGPGHLLFTTRSRSLGGLAQRLDIEQMEPEIGALLLLRRASLLTIQATLNMAKPDDQRLARAISQELDGLPLALDQAGTYIKEAPCPLPDYLAHYQTRRSDILRVRGSFDQDYPASVATTWSLSFEKVAKANPAAAELLTLCAFLAPDAIPEEMMKWRNAFGPILQNIAVDPLRLNEAIKELLKYSLIRRNAETLTTHRLVQAVLQDSMDEQARRAWAERTARAITSALPNPTDVTGWEKYERYLPHALVCATFIEDYSFEFAEAATLLSKTAEYLRSHARFVQAEPLYERALAIRERSGDSKTLGTLYNLAALYVEQGKYEQAEQLLQSKHEQGELLYQQALAIWEASLGREHIDVVYPLNNLANLYKAQGKHAQVEPLYQRALAIREQWEQFLLRGLALVEQQLGLEHSDVAYVLNDLANLYKAQGKYAQAEPLYQRALAIWEKSLGPEHPDTQKARRNYASLLAAMKSQKAEE